MKKLLVILFSFFLLSSPSVFAEDISDFSIEGMSIGDSLLDYMTEEKILEKIEKNKGRFQYLNEPNKYIQISLIKNLGIYDRVIIFIKNNSSNLYISDKNEKYTILSITGAIDFIKDHDGCIQKRDEIKAIVSNMFPGIDNWEGKSNYRSDPSGESFLEVIEFLFPSGAEIELQCLNIEESFRIQKNWAEGLRIVIDTKEIIEWLNN